MPKRRRRGATVVFPLTGEEHRVSERQVRRFQKTRAKADAGPVKLMPEYSVDVPLWGRRWEELGLPPDLIARLSRWQEEFDAGFRPFKGWTSDEVRDRWSAQAQELASGLRKALPDGVPLEVDLWPLDPD